MPATVCTAGVADIGFAKDGENILAPGLSLDSYNNSQKILSSQLNLNKIRKIIDKKINKSKQYHCLRIIPYFQ